MARKVEVPVLQSKLQLRLPNPKEISPEELLELNPLLFKRGIADAIRDREDRIQELFSNPKSPTRSYRPEDVEEAEQAKSLMGEARASVLNKIDDQVQEILKKEGLTEEQILATVDNLHRNERFRAEQELIKKYPAPLDPSVAKHEQKPRWDYRNPEAVKEYQAIQTSRPSQKILDLYRELTDHRRRLTSVLQQKASRELLTRSPGGYEQEMLDKEVKRLEEIAAEYRKKGFGVPNEAFDRLTKLSEQEQKNVGDLKDFAFETRDRSSETQAGRRLARHAEAVKIENQLKDQFRKLNNIPAGEKLTDAQFEAFKMFRDANTEGGKKLSGMLFSDASFQNAQRSHEFESLLKKITFGEQLSPEDTQKILEEFPDLVAGGGKLIKGVPMHYQMPPEAVRADLREMFPKGTSTAELIGKGLRSSTTRAKFADVGDVVEFQGVPGKRFRVREIRPSLTSLMKDQSISEEAWREWAQREGWDPEFIKKNPKLLEQVRRSGSVQTLFEPFDPFSPENLEQAGRMTPQRTEQLARAMYGRLSQGLRAVKTRGNMGPDMAAHTEKMLATLEELSRTSDGQAVAESLVKADPLAQQALSNRFAYALDQAGGNKAAQKHLTSALSELEKGNFTKAMLHYKVGGMITNGDVSSDMIEGYERQIDKLSEGRHRFAKGETELLGELEKRDTGEGVEADRAKGFEEGRYGFEREAQLKSEKLLEEETAKRARSGLRRTMKHQDADLQQLLRSVHLEDNPDARQQLEEYVNQKLGEIVNEAKEGGKLTVEHQRQIRELHSFLYPERAASSISPLLTMQTPQAYRSTLEDQVRRMTRDSLNRSGVDPKKWNAQIAAALEEARPEIDEAVRKHNAVFLSYGGKASEVRPGLAQRTSPVIATKVRSGKKRSKVDTEAVSDFLVKKREQEKVATHLRSYGVHEKFSPKGESLGWFKEGRKLEEAELNQFLSLPEKTAAQIASELRTAQAAQRTTRTLGGAAKSAEAYASAAEVAAPKPGRAINLLSPESKVVPILKAILRNVPKI